MKDVVADNSEELLSILGNIDISVPPRKEGRTTDHCETWSICRLLATLAKHERLYFPVRLAKREKPDFLLVSGDQHIGIEVTEAINPDYAKATTLPEANIEGATIDPSLFKWGAPPRKLHELRTIVARKKLTGPGWESTSVESEYAEAIFDVITVKTEKLQATGFDRFAENWLAIYCNITLPALELEDANEFFAEKASDYWRHGGFSAVFVEEGENIIWYSREGTEVLRLVDLWALG